MSAGTDALIQAFRQFVLDQVPASGDNAPDMPEIRAAFVQLGMDLASLSAGITRVDTFADLPVVTTTGGVQTPANGSQFLVYADATSANNKVYVVKAGVIVVDTDYYNALAAVVAPYATEAAASAAATAATAAQINTKLRVLPGPTRTVTVDQNGWIRAISTPTEDRSPALDAVAANALAGASSAKPRARKRIVSQHGGWIETSDLGTPLSNGTTQQSAFFRVPFTMLTDAVGLQFLFINKAEEGSGIGISPGNALNLYASVEINGNECFTITRGNSNGDPVSTSPAGRTGAWLGDSEYMLTQPLFGQLFAAGSTQYYREFIQVPSGGKWPYMLSSEFITWMGGQTTDVLSTGANNNGSNQATNYGDQAWNNFNSTDRCFGATAIIGTQVTPKVVVMITGDSISAGQSGDIVGRSFIGLALSDAGIGYHNDGMGGTQLLDIAVYGWVQQFLADYVDYIALHAGTNDLGVAYSQGSTAAGLAYMKARFKAAVLTLARAENRIVLSTILPRPTTSNDLVDYAGQGIQNFEAIRVETNNWIRDTTPTGAVAELNADLGVGTVHGIIDGCSAAEYTSAGAVISLSTIGGIANQQVVGTGGLWITNGTPWWAASNNLDGTAVHPTTNIASLLAGTVNPGLFTLF